MARMLKSQVRNKNQAIIALVFCNTVCYCTRAARAISLRIAKHQCNNGFIFIPILTFKHSGHKKNPDLNAF